MAGHFLLSAQARDLSVIEVQSMRSNKVHELFVQARWGTDGTQVCPTCGVQDSHYVVPRRRQWVCKHCRRMFSVTSETIFSDHKLPLKTLLVAMVLFVHSVKGLSAMQLQRNIKVSYTTARLLLMKLREALLVERDTSKMSGLVQIDGAHLSGRPRKGRTKKVANAKGEQRDKIPPSSNPTDPNRRIVMVVRQIDRRPGKGATRTIVEVVKAEERNVLQRLAHKYVEEGSTIWTDELGGFVEYSLSYDHRTVNHKKEFSTKEGVSNNHAESYHSRMRRMVIGQAHRVTPKFMLDYVNEVAWREDVRRLTCKQQVLNLLSKVVKAPISPWYAGYYQRKPRCAREEILFTANGPEDPVVMARLKQVSAKAKPDRHA